MFLYKKSLTDRPQYDQLGYQITIKANLIRLKNDFPLCIKIANFNLYNTSRQKFRIESNFRVLFMNLGNTISFLRRNKCKNKNRIK